MKKPQVLNKLKRYKTEDAGEVAEDAGGQRVTNDTVLQHRNEVLSKGRRFKYPLQHSKHRVVGVSIAVVLLGLLLLGGFTGLQLYRWQSISDFTYRVTQVLPFPVAKVNGAYTPYENYLFELRSSLHWQAKYGTTDLNSPDGKRQIEYLKYSALNKAMQITVAHQLAKQHHISVSDAEVNSVVDRIKSSGGNLDQILGEQFDFTQSELKRYIKDNILEQKVAKKLDTEAPKRAAEAVKQLKAGKPFANVAKIYSEDLETKQLGGDLGTIERGHANLPTEVAQKIFELKPGQISDVISTSSDYYIIKVTEKVNENRVKVSMIQVKVKPMSRYLEEYSKHNKVTKYIKLNSIDPQTQAN